MREQLSHAVLEAQTSRIREFAQLAARTPGTVSLTLGEPDFATPQPAVDAVAEAFAAGETHYIANPGTLELREAIADFERRTHHCDYTADEVIVTAGATEALAVAFQAVLNPGDEVVIPIPAFSLYAEQIRLAGATPVFLNTTDDDFQISADALAAVMTERTKAILLNSPNNPTGVALNQHSLENVATVLRQRPMFAILDDVYRQLHFDGDLPTLTGAADLREQLIVVQSFSKPYAMTGWRMGYLLADRTISDRLALVHQYSVVSTPAPFQRAAIAALACDISEMKAVFERRRDFVLKRLGEMGLPTVRPSGAFYAFPSIRDLSIGSEDFCRRAITEAGVALTPGTGFGVEGCVRLSYATSDEQLAEGLSRLERFLASLRKEEVVS